MKAPSEKHLEDWIVANPDLFADYGESEDDELGYPLIQQFVGQQIILPSGRLDLLAIRDMNNCAPLSLSVVELKKGNITYEVLAQCLRYMHDLREVYYWTFMDFISGIGVPFDALTDVEQYPFKTFEPITGLLVGHRLADHNMVQIAAAANVTLVTYDYIEDENFYCFYDHQPTGRGSIDDYKTHVSGKIGGAFREVIRQHAQRYPRKDSVQS